MDRYLITFIFVAAISISCAFDAAVIQAEDSESKKQALTQEQAAELAAKLANEKFQKDYHRSPFKPESYAAELIESRWHWGKIDPAGINGCSATVEFKEDGSDERVKVALCIDVNTKDISEEKAPIVIRGIQEDVQKENQPPEVAPK
jgi:hypothetical protein